MKVAVVGAGSWGTTVAALTAANAETVLWVRRSELAERIDRTHENPEYLAGVALPENLRATSSLEEACGGAGVIVMGVPSHGFRSVLTDARPFIGAEVPVVSLSKGVEQGTLRRMTEVVAEVLDGHVPDRIGVLTGPNLARSGRPRSVCTRTPTSWGARSPAR